MSKNYQSVKLITPPGSTYHQESSNQKQPQQPKILQVGDRVTANFCGKVLLGIITAPLLDPPDIEALQGAEFLILGDRTWRVNLQSDRWLACCPREFVSLADGGTA